jgi:hypothetical protein
MLAEIVHAAGAAGKSAIIGEYIDSGRNSLVREHYRKLGFARDAAAKDPTRWRLAIAGFKAPALPFAVEQRPQVVAGGVAQMQKAGAV